MRVGTENTLVDDITLSRCIDQGVDVVIKLLLLEVKLKLKHIKLI